LSPPSARCGNGQRHLRVFGRMRLALMWFAVMWLAALPAKSFAQQNEIAGIFAHTFVSDQGAVGAAFNKQVVHFGNGFTFEASYARHVMGRGQTTLALEIPLVMNTDEDLSFASNVVPEGYRSYFLTPSLRATFLERDTISPWLSLGGGLTYFSPSATLVFGGTNPVSNGSASGALQVGVGFDVKVYRRIRLRTAVRDFYTGLPPLNVDTGRSRQHNYFVGVGLAWRF
jgi:hypothetical protein